MENDENNGKELKIELPKELAKGEYANLAIITHSSSDFIIDCAAMLPGMPKAIVRSRVVMAPEHAKRLLLALQENIMKYEKEFGTIQIRQAKGGVIAPFQISKNEA
ncbi:MAG: DUF3467 domain-containing protein [Prevotella sp.]|nr:DUF3467 domain-containing protein [Prevotella sp.]